jgi:hypothetical protein
MGSTTGAEFGDAGGGSAGDAGGVGSDAEIAAARKSVAAAGGAAPPVAGGGPPTIKPEDYIEFGGNTGSMAHFKQLTPEIQANFLQMAQAYNNMTGGKRLRVNSAFRSPEEQAAVNPGTNPKAAPGMSLHQKGRAVDINSDQRAFLESSGLLSQFGFKPLPGDPPHIFAKDGFSGTITGPTSGYTPNMVMHGTEELSIKPTTGAGAIASGDNMNAGLLSAQLSKMEELVTAMKRQNDISSKILAYQS